MRAPYLILKLFVFQPLLCNFSKDLCLAHFSIDFLDPSTVLLYEDIACRRSTLLLRSAILVNTLLAFGL